MIGLFSIENQYYQPDNNLVALFEEKPSLELLAKALNISFPCSNDTDTLNVVNIWNSIDGVSYCINDTNYRLETIEFFK